VEFLFITKNFLSYPQLDIVEDFKRSCNGKRPE